MSTPKQRVELELTDLNSRLVGLNHFLDSARNRDKVGSTQATLMYLQADKMKDYAHTLKRRLEEWDNG